MKPKSRVAPTKAKPGIKFDATKLRYDLLPAVAIDQLMTVMTFGAVKYGPDNWRKVDEAEDRYFAAAMRHLMAFQAARKRGNHAERFDPETGLSHLSHALTCLAFLTELEVGLPIDQKQLEDLLKKAAAARAGAK